MQFEKLKGLLGDIRANGQKIVLGGEIDEMTSGYFIPVTVVDNPPENSRIVQEEQFGPIVPIIGYDDIEDVIARANNSPLGVGSGSNHWVRMRIFMRSGHSKRPYPMRSTD